MTGFALFAATRAHICTLTAYHFQILCWLFALVGVSTISSTLLVVDKSAVDLFGPGRDPAACKGRRRRIAFMCVRILALLAFLVVISFFPITLASSWTPKFPQPALSIRAFCYFNDNKPIEFGIHLSKVVDQLTILSMWVGWAFLMFSVAHISPLARRRARWWFGILEFGGLLYALGLCRCCLLSLSRLVPA